MLGSRCMEDEVCYSFSGSIVLTLYHCSSWDQLLLCATMQPGGFHVVQMSMFEEFSIAALSVVTEFLVPQIIDLVWVWK